MVAACFLVCNYQPEFWPLPSGFLSIKTSRQHHGLVPEHKIVPLRCGWKISQVRWHCLDLPPLEQNDSNNPAELGAQSNTNLDADRLRMPNL